MTPSTDGRGAWQDPTHLSGWNENSFWYHTDASFARFVPELLECPFQVSYLRTYYPSQWHAEHLIPYVQANLIALKPDGDRNGGIINW
jgi:O-antigen biosynthesis protein